MLNFSRIESQLPKIVSQIDTDLLSLWYLTTNTAFVTFEISRWQFHYCQNLSVSWTIEFWPTSLLSVTFKILKWQLSQEQAFLTHPYNYLFVFTSTYTALISYRNWLFLSRYFSCHVRIILSRTLGTDLHRALTRTPKGQTRWTENSFIIQMPRCQRPQKIL